MKPPGMYRRDETIIRGWTIVTTVNERGDLYLKVSYPGEATTLVQYANDHDNVEVLSEQADAIEVVLVHDPREENR